MALSNNARTGAILGVVLPFCTYLYSAQQQRLEHSRQQHQIRQQALEVAAEKDKEMAVKLREALRPWDLPVSEGATSAGQVDRSADGLCKFLLGEARMAVSGVYGPQALGLVVSTLRSPAPNAREGAVKLACHCQNVPAAIELEDLFADTEQKMPARRRRELAPAIAELRDVYDSCSRHASDAQAAAYTAPLAYAPAAVAATPVEAPKPVAPMASQAPARASVPQNLSTALRRFFTPKIVAQHIRVYIHIASDSQLPAAECLKSELADLGYAMPPIDNVGEHAPPLPQLRYFKPQEKRLAAALLPDVLDAARACQQQSPAVKVPIDGLALQSFTHLKTSARPNHFELWLAREAE